MSLVLTRKIGEAICIGESVRVIVVAIQGDKVRLAVEAPRDLPVNRAEVHEKILMEKLNDTGDTKRKR